MSAAPPSRLQPWPVLERDTALDIPIFAVRRERTVSPRTGQAHDFYVIDGHDWVNVVALTPERDLVLVRQWRHGTKQLSLEIPGGVVEPGEAPEAAARRELREETGYEAARWRCLGAVHPNPAIQSNTCHLYLAEGAAWVGEPTPDFGEDFEVERVPFADVPRMLKDGEIRHALVVAALHFYSLG